MTAGISLIRGKTGAHWRCEEVGIGVIPLLASPQGGVAASSKKVREATKAGAAGVVFLLYPIGKPPRPRYQRTLREIY
jgi:hypothetical protein